jgi:hypothetical protein
LGKVFPSDLRSLWNTPISIEFVSGDLEDFGGGNRIIRRQSTLVAFNKFSKNFLEEPSG